MDFNWWAGPGGGKAKGGGEGEEEEALFLPSEPYQR